MKLLMSCAALALGLAALPASAQSQGPSPKKLHFVLGLGLTNGGDKLADVQFNDGSSDSIKAGGLVHFFGGVEYRFTPQWSTEVNIGYHVSDTREATNGSLKFARVPVELLGRYTINPRWRVAAGVRHSTNVKFKGSGVLAQTNEGFDNATGFAIEGEYLFTRNIGMKLRAVSEKFKSKDFLDKVNGNHVGLYLVGYL
jgi:hypothetical protein